MSQSPLKINNISKQFKTKKVLQNISLEVKKGEIFGLIGENGIGKTTLIKIVLDLLNADTGSVTILGKNSSNNASRENICYLPEKFQPSPFLKGKEFLSIALSFHKKTLDSEQAKKLAICLGLAPEALDQKIGKYSKGMAQKLGLLSIFLIDTPLLILDEPMSGLDPSARIKLKQQLTRYKKSGKTVFFSSHILADIEEICDRMTILHNKELIFTGRPADYLKKSKEKTLEKAFLKTIENS